MLELIESEMIENVTLSYAEDKGAALSPQHREYLEGRHGTVNKTPLPSADPEDPLNWPDWKKNTALLTLALHSLIATYSPNAISPAFIIISRDLGVSVTAATYLLSATLLPMGLSSFLWIPISNRFGRRPMWLMASLLPACFNLGLALAKDFPTMVVLQVLSGLFLSPSLTLVSAVITELFFVEERGQKMGLWTSALNLGPPCAPFLMGFVVERTNTYKYIYYVQAAALILVFFLHLFCTPETMYKPRLDGLDKSNFKHQYVAIEKYPDSPLDVATFAFPLKLFAYPNIVIPAIIQAVVLNFAGIFMTVEIPVIYPQIYGSTPSKVGCQFIGLIVGTVIGGWLGGRGSDIWMERHRKKVGDRAEPEHRVWLCYPGYILCLIGVLAFCIGLARSTHLHYTVVPTVGASIFAAGNQVIGNVMITYSVDCHARYSHTIGFFFNMWRTVLGFIGPFCYPSMIENCGYYGLAGVMLACVAALSLAPTIAVQVAGKRFRIHKHRHEGAME
ncbi:major facilitator superfamily domain-containing protein [Ilyonectria sp. MPI-CAGE-AT-0026]|nr:major facilitator superfamily domain-containing protein [Ilyonectria sp. MPI-CAGE-AT-0026]